MIIVRPLEFAFSETLLKHSQVWYSSAQLKMVFIPYWFYRVIITVFLWDSMVISLKYKGSVLLHSELAGWSAGYKGVWLVIFA
jgi:hypothetical protein